jgi:activator of HSP90 ATPase
MPAKNLHQTVQFRASPKEVFALLVDPKKHAMFTGMPAKLERRPGGKFSHYGDSLTGFVVELIPSKRIVLAWRESTWPEGHHSIAWFELKPKGKGTQLTFEQFGVPTNRIKDIGDGWKEYYWQPMKTYLEG